MSLKNFIRKLSRARFPYRPLISIEISKKNLLHNLAEFQKVSGLPVAPVLKSNAYGHGLLQVAKIFEHHGNQVPFLVVDSYFEAIALRNEGIRKPILIIGYTPVETIVKSNLKNVAFGITTLATLEELSKQTTRMISIHLKINTGMNRQGIDESELEQALSLLKSNENIELAGIMSHLANADMSNDAFTKGQIQRWNALVKKTKESFPKLSYYHLSNTPGHAYSREINANVTRPGIGLFGIAQEGGAPIDAQVHLLPVLKFKTVISGIRTVEKGAKIGYGLSYTAETPMKIATIPVGYFEGVDRRLSNKGFVKVGGQFSPIVGRVSMNITVVDVTNIPSVAVGDEVIVVGDNPEDKNSIVNIAKLCDTIPYEIPVHIPGHLLRIVVA